MDEIAVENFRCFQKRQTARLAPLTLLVGENSTGKTSFLALIRALTSVGFGMDAPDFKAAPYDLGSFDEIAHHRGARGSRAKQFTAGITAGPRIRSPNPWSFDITFGRRGTAPAPVLQRLSRGSDWIEGSYDASGELVSLKAGTKRGQWQVVQSSRSSGELNPVNLWRALLMFGNGLDDELVFHPINDSPKIVSDDIKRTGAHCTRYTQALAAVCLS